MFTNDVEIFGDKSRIKQMLKWHFYGCLPYFKKTKNKISILDFRKANRIPTFSCCMVRKDIMDKCDFYSSVVNNTLDWHLWRQICATEPVYFINQRLTFWRASQNSLSVSQKINGFKYLEKQRKQGDIILLKQHPWKARLLRRYMLDTYKSLPRFSIIMIVDKKDPHVHEAISSILHQTYQYFELIREMLGYDMHYL